VLQEGSGDPGRREGPAGLRGLIPPFDPAAPGLAIATAIGLGFAVGIFPVGLAEAAAVAIGVLQPPSLAIALLVAFTIGHVAAKCPWYWAGTHAEKVRWGVAVRGVVRAREVIARHPNYGHGLLGVSAVTSVPPFHLAAIAAGLVRLPLPTFLALCLGGRLVRFGALGALPSLLRGWLG
jgi:membrane protein YqaA with SNARE-associated domain